MWLYLVLKYFIFEKDVRMRLKIQLLFIFTVLLTMLMISIMTAQTSAGYTQQIYVINKLIPSIKSIGIISNTATEPFIEATRRAGLSSGIKVIIAKANSPQEIPELYQTLRKKEVKMIWLPDKNDVMLLEKGFEYLRETTLEDKIGLCVPVSKMVSEGALCCIQIEGNKLTVYIDRRVAQAIGATIPNDPDSSIKYVLK